MITSLDREELYLRHQLSHQQIDDLLGERKANGFPESKAQHLSALTAFSTVTGLFESESVDFLPQKGPVLSYRLYGDPLYRVYRDLDFLLREEDVARVAEVLTANGFLSPVYRVPAGRCRRRILFRHVNELYMYSPALDAGIELHWSMFNARLTTKSVHDRMVIDNTTVISFSGRDYSILKEEAELLFLVIHGGLHAWSRLKWLVDIKVFLERIDFSGERFLSLARQLNVQRLVGLCNTMLAYWFPGSRLLPSDDVAPAGMVRHALKQIKSPDRKKSLQDNLSLFGFAWQAVPGSGYRADLIARNLYATDLASAGWIPCFAPAYYLVSPVWKLIRGFR
jgi:hypothetical protein